MAANRVLNPVNFMTGIAIRVGAERRFFGRPDFIRIDHQIDIGAENIAYDAEAS